MHAACFQFEDVGFTLFDGGSFKFFVGVEHGLEVRIVHDAEHGYSLDGHVRVFVFGFGWVMDYGFLVAFSKSLGVGGMEMLPISHGKELMRSKTCCVVHEFDRCCIPNA